MSAMFDKSLKYSYAAQKKQRYKLLRILAVVLVFFLVVNAFNMFLFSTWVLRSDTMRPGLHTGDRFLVYSSAIPSLLEKISGGGDSVPFKRGNIVLVDTGRSEEYSRLFLAADSVVRFFTAQRISLFEDDEHLYLKRLAALPGDEVSMINFILRIRPAGSSYTLTEFELSARPYYPDIPQVPALWDDSLPFSGNMEPFVLGPGECFVVSDDRRSSGDSRTWGPVNAEAIIGRPLFRFWPFTRIGRP